MAYDADLAGQIRWQKGMSHITSDLCCRACKSTAFQLRQQPDHAAHGVGARGGIRLPEVQQRLLMQSKSPFANQNSLCQKEREHLHNNLKCYSLYERSALKGSRMNTANCALPSGFSGPDATAAYAGWRRTLSSRYGQTSHCSCSGGRSCAASRKNSVAANRSSYDASGGRSACCMSRPLSAPASICSVCFSACVS